MNDSAARLAAALEGRYRVERELGQGGMATVYLAEDLKHDRKVALKVLKPELAAVVGAERFISEIRTTANLQHPHILPLFDSGEADGFLYYAMPYVEGETLRDRLDRERQLPVDEAVAITQKVAGALQAAHEQGVIHRDVKPANILLQRGEPVVSDFGIALAVSQAGGGRLTETGLSLGTPYYMAPEQATGDRDPDQRSDLYSLACMLYEMLAGDPPFTASTAQGVLGKILTGTREPVETLRPSTPPHVAAAVDRALERLPADRFASVEAFGEALADPGFRSRRPGSGGAAFEVPEGSGTRRRAGTAVLVVVLAAVAVAGWLRPGGSDGGTPVAGVVTEARIHTSSEVRHDLWTEFAVSPEGDRLVFTGRDSAGTARLWLRPLAEEEIAPVPGTEDGAYPFWSPDGRSVGFIAAGQLRRLDLETGRIRSLCPVDAARPAHWAGGDDIYFSHAGSIFRTRADEGTCERVTNPEEGGVDHGWPTALPDGRLLYSSRDDDGSIWLVEPGRPPTLFLEGAWNPTFLAPDWLLYHDNPILTGEKPLLARRIDPETLEFRTDPAPVFDSLWTPNGTARYSASASGVLVASRAPESAVSTVWVDRDGEVRSRAVTGGWTFDPASRGLRVAAGGWGLWVWDSERDVVERVPVGLGLRRLFFQPAWSPGDSLLAYGALLAGPHGLFTYHLRDGREDTLRITDGRTVEDVAWTPGGDTLVYRLEPSGSSAGGSELRVHARSTGVDELLFTAQVGEPIQQTLEVSPDGAWLLYSSTASGVRDLYVRSWPGLDAPRRVTASGGLRGRWSPGGDTIFYETGADELMAVPFGDRGPGSMGVAVSLGRSDDLSEFWGVDDETGHFLRRERLEADRAPPMRLVTNWIARAEGRGR